MKKRLGVIGGMGAQASQLFYQKVIDNTYVQCDQDHIDMVLWSHASMPDRTTYLLQGKQDALWQELKSDIHLLLDAKCDYITLTCNTAHYFLDPMQQESNGKIIAMTTASAQYAKTHYGNKVGVLATTGTVKFNTYGRALQALGCECIYPSQESQDKIMTIIYDEIKKGEKGSLKLFMEVAKEMKDKGCDVLLLACTELSVLKNNYNTLANPYYLDAMDVLVKECIEACGGTYQGVL